MGKVFGIMRLDPRKVSGRVGRAAVRGYGGSISHFSLRVKHYFRMVGRVDIAKCYMRFWQLVLYFRRGVRDNGLVVRGITPPHKLN